MSGFANSVVGGASNLVRKAIQSVPFVSGSQGWRVQRNGNAEFNNVQIRGSFFGPDLIMDSTGIYMYNGIPAVGNFPVFAACVPGVTQDPVGNSLTNAAVLTRIESGVISIPATAPQFQIDGNRKALFTYDAGTVLQAAIAAAAGSDFFGHNFPAGLFGQQLTLNNQSSAPPSFSGGSVFYSSVAGRPRYLSSAGADNVLQRSDVNVAQFTQGNSTSTTPVSASLSYLAGEGNQGSEYEIEIDGVITTGSVTAQTLTFTIRDNGFVFGGTITIGAVVLPINTTYAYSIRGRVTLLTSGGGGTCVITLDGGISRQGANAGSSTSPLLNVNLNATSGGTTKPIDTTTAHTFDIAASWGGLNTGQSLTTYRTRITRRF